MITPTTQVMHPDDRLSIWTAKRGAYMNNERAVNHFGVRPVNTVNLATRSPQRRKQAALLPLFLNIVGGAVLFCAAFWLVALLGFAMENMK